MGAGFSKGNELQASNTINPHSIERKWSNGGPSKVSKSTSPPGIRRIGVRRRSTKSSVQINVEAINPCNGLPFLPIEIWQHIFSFVKQPLPPPHVKSGWSQLHQQDLTSLARVCRHFNHIATPMLYEEPIVNNPFRFFRYLNDVNDPKSKSDSWNARKTKLDCLRYVKRLQLVYAWEGRTAFATTTGGGRQAPRALSDAEGNGDTESVLAHLVTDAANAIQAAHILTTYTKRFHKLKGKGIVQGDDAGPPLILPAIEAVTIGKYGDGQWDANFDQLVRLSRPSQIQSQTGTPSIGIIREWLHHPRDFALRLHSLSQPRYVCQRGSSGPFNLGQKKKNQIDKEEDCSPWTFNLDDQHRPEIYVHHLDTLGPTKLPIIRGTTNQFVLCDTLVQAYCHDLGQYYTFVSQLREHLQQCFAPRTSSQLADGISISSSRKGSTCIDLYFGTKVFDLRRIMRKYVEDRTLPQEIRGVVEGGDEESIRRAMEMWMVHRDGQSVEQDREWCKMVGLEVRFMMVDEVGGCPACGVGQ
ncbi:hypothetical protein CI109_100173 [Kwoniella shandongensis]|uniref:Uncharacterized protein n=1 Tax=Kwoniella shandongensis TaxID=1734106 RepID=A0A5M6BUK4_9TREE|nr:uncharacterized protein CI109_005773 [Kwoniella shandongensis]KAA5525891.1 hypothetical protein CI109_005773 [Kwoniella shandongensis]